MRGGINKMLFNNVSVLEVLPDQERRIKAKIQSFGPDYLLNVSEEDLVASLTDEYTLDVPVLDEAGIHLDHGEHQVDVSRDPMRFIPDPSRPFYVPGTRVIFIAPFMGDANLLRVQPQNFTYSLGGSKAEIVGSAIHVTFASANLNAEAVRQQFDNELRQIKQNLGNLKVAVDRHNAGLAQLYAHRSSREKASCSLTRISQQLLGFRSNAVTAHRQLTRCPFKSVDL